VANLSFDALVADLGAETLDLENLNLRFMGLDVTGDLSGRNLMSDLSLAGAVDIARFDPRDILDVYGLEIETADDNVFRAASARAELVYDSTQIGLRNMTLMLDDSTLTGSMGLRGGDEGRFMLAVDDINIDRYLPPAAEPEDGAEPDEGSLDEVDLPIDVFRTLDAEGELRLGRTQFTGLQLTDAVFALSAGDGRVRLTPRAALYGGTINGEIRIDVQGDAAQFGLAQSLRNVDLLGLGRDYLDTEAITGTGNVTLDLVAVGRNMGELMRALDGTISFSATDGAWEGFDAWYELRRARAVTSGNDAPARNGARRTPYSSVSASGTIEDALLTNDDFNASLGFMSIDGTGTVNLLSNELDFDVTARFVDGELLQSDPGWPRSRARRCRSALAARWPRLRSDPTSAPWCASGLARKSRSASTKSAARSRSASKRSAKRCRNGSAIDSEESSTGERPQSGCRRGRDLPRRGAGVGCHDPDARCHEGARPV
jgi:AsmA protein